MASNGKSERSFTHGNRSHCTKKKDFIKIWSESVRYGDFQLQIEKELVAPVMRVQLNDLGKMRKLLNIESFIFESLS